MKFIDLYAGIGGFRFALEELGHECVFSAGIDKYAIETYENNFPSHKAFFNMDSLQEMSNNEIEISIPDHDILVAGFPCQPFSVGGKKLGFNTIDTKGQQFFNIAKILEIKKPKYILLENVFFLTKHNNGETYKKMKYELEKLGYKIPDTPFVLSPHEIGIPQRRKRIFMYAIYNHEPIEHPIIKNDYKMKAIFRNGIKNQEELFLDSYTENVISAWEEFAQIVKSPNGNKIPDIWLDEMIGGILGNKDDKEWRIDYLKNMNKFYLFNKIIIDKWVEKWNPLSFKKRERKFEWRAGDEKPNFKNCIIILRTSGVRIQKKPVFPTLVAMGQVPILFDTAHKKYRFLSLKELSDLQSFPKNFKNCANKNQAIKQFGNSVNIDVIKLISKHLLS
ncbi:MAG: DNA (cytosine-5-)-methyltransferase, partial [Mycoplasmataceae bacterium]|nr:DNA (cytosine-5-)-methyltransferase [Mycoplasmataceae bacterium]